MIPLGKRWRLHEDGTDAWVEEDDAERMVVLDAPEMFGGADAEQVDELRLASAAPEGYELAEQILTLHEAAEERDFGTHFALPRATWAGLVARALELRLKARGF